jgi:regulatory protein
MNLESIEVESRRARNAVNRLLKIRMRSELEIRGKLLQKGFSERVVDEVVQFFTKAKLINDRQFARMWINSRLIRPFGLSRIRFELHSKGIDKDIIESELSEIASGFDEDSVVCDLAKRRAAKFKNIKKDKLKQRVYGYLLRRGFSPSAVIKAIKKI